jgi:hypothetical protein
VLLFRHGYHPAAASPRIKRKRIHITVIIDFKGSLIKVGKFISRSRDQPSILSIYLEEHSILRREARMIVEDNPPGDHDAHQFPYEYK